MKKFLFCIMCIFYTNNALADFSDLPDNEYKKQAKVYIDECIQKYYPNDENYTIIFKPLFHDTKTISGLDNYNNCLKEKIIELLQINPVKENIEKLISSLNVIEDGVLDFYGTLYHQIDTGLIGQRVNFDVVGRQYERILYDVLLYQDIYGINDITE
ncbi:MAG: hypothetical protein E7005_01655 [Alphaproteobacteria bacterium]|nr:hypothetical protein [Alphaproteobacteria bacterium]